MGNKENVIEYLSKKPIGTIFSTSSFKRDLSSTYGNSEGSYIPSDYCYNSYCIGSQWDKRKPTLLLERLENGKFKYLGINYPYSGSVIDKNGNVYGKWDNGIFSKNVDYKDLQMSMPLFSTQEWINILSDKSITNENNLRFLLSIKDFGGSATCTQLSLKYGFSMNYYSNNLSSYGQRISKKYNIGLNTGYWTILFTGYSAPKEIDGCFVWELKSELNEALDRIDTSNISLYKNQDNNKENEMLQQPKNQILYGPPGTGKTYNTVVEAMKIISYKDFFCEWYLEEYCKKNNVKLPQKTLNDYINHLEKINLELLKNDSIFQYWNLSDFQNLKQKILDSPYIQDYSSRSNPNSYFNHALKRYSEFLNDLTYKKIKNYFDKLKEQGQIEFVTFHQSYSYEEFVEGIKPVLNAEQIQYDKKKGVFKQICESAGAKTTSNFDDVYEKFIRNIEESGSLYFLETLTHKKRFGIDVNSNGSLNLYTGANYKQQGTLTKEHLKNRSNWKSYSTAIYQHLVKQHGLLESNIAEIKPHVLIIDEINRGNISKIFGELITLIEEDKRLGEANEVTVKLPYAEEGEPPFGVPSNLYIIGTMNTSDRSIASVDIALRRRFKFKEMMPNVELIKKNDDTSRWYILGDDDSKPYSVDLKMLLETLNKRITILLDRDHQIGHSYFLDLIKDENGKIKENLTVTELKEMWFSCIQPLLNEYFYGDWEKLQALLGKASDSNNSFIKVIENDCLLNGYSCDTNELCDFTHKDDINFKEALSTAFKDAI